MNGSGDIVAYTGYTFVGASGTTIADSSAGAPTNVQINFVAQGSTFNLSPAANGVTNINTLFLNTANNSTVAVTGTLRLGVNGGILSDKSNSLTIGSSAGSGVSTAGGNHANTPGEITITGLGTSGETFTINSDITDNGSGAVTLTLNGGGVAGTTNNYVTLAGANTYSGGTYIDAARMVVTSTNAFGTGQVTVMAGVQANLDATGTFTNNWNLASVGQGEGGQESAIRIGFANTTQTLSGNINLLGDAIVENSYTSAATLSGNISGNHTLNLFGSIFVLTGTDTLGGNLAINGFVPGVPTGGAMTVQISGTAALPSGSGSGNVIINGSTTAGSNDILDIHGISVAMNGLVSAGANGGQAVVTNLAASGQQRHPDSWWQ